MSESIEHRFGGPWTEIKLSVLKKYLDFYTQALKHKPFELLYIDAFAGTGSRIEEIPASPMFNTDKTEIRYEGSAKIALGITRKFDRYLFVENDPKKIIALNLIKDSHPDDNITIKQGDANQIIQSIALKDCWKSSKYRGVIFLDPYGNEVEWETLKAIAATKSLDVWFLFPLSGVYRQASHDKAKLEKYKKESLNRMFGTDSWEAAFYKKIENSQDDLFGNNELNESRIPVQDIEQWVKLRLNECFPYVAEPLPLPLNGAQLYSLFFCVSNKLPKAKGLALKAADFILKQHGR